MFTTQYEYNAIHKFIYLIPTFIGLVYFKIYKLPGIRIY